MLIDGQVWLRQVLIAMTPSHRLQANKTTRPAGKKYTLTLGLHRPNCYPNWCPWRDWRGLQSHIFSHWCSIPFPPSFSLHLSFNTGASPLLQGLITPLSIIPRSQGQLLVVSFVCLQLRNHFPMHGILFFWRLSHLIIYWLLNWWCTWVDDIKDCRNTPGTVVIKNGIKAGLCRLRVRVSRSVISSRSLTIFLLSLFFDWDGWENGWDSIFVETERFEVSLQKVCLTHAIIWNTPVFWYLAPDGLNPCCSSVFILARCSWFLRSRNNL